MGFALFNGLGIPAFWASYTAAVGHKPINTSDKDFNDVFNTLFSSYMFSGMICALVLDNIIPGTDEERGLHVWSSKAGTVCTPEEQQELDDTYDLPWKINKRCAAVLDPIFAPIAAMLQRKK